MFLSPKLSFRVAPRRPAGRWWRPLTLAIGLLLTLASTSLAQPWRHPARTGPAPSPTAAGRSLAEALLPDGRLRPGSQGSFAATGYRLASDPVTGQPTFRTTGTGDEQWQDGDGVVGTNYPVSATAIAPNGDVYVGGAFTIAGNVIANGIARWDGTAWHALGSGVSGGGNTYPFVAALAIGPNGEVYAAGSFDTAGGVAATNIARWNGTSWSALGTGLGSSFDFVQALAVSTTGEVYAGGTFNTAGGSAANRVAKWTGGSWSALGTGVNGWVYSLALATTGELYVGGDFTTAGSGAAAHVARWNGTAWSPMAAGLNGTVRALAVGPNSDVYGVGDITTTTGVAATYVARWNGSAWSPLGTGTSLQDSDSFVSGFSLAVSATGTVYVGGSFIHANGAVSNNVARWNGSQWVPMDAGFTGSINEAPAVFALAISPTTGDVYAGGDFLTANGRPTTYIARWNGTSWQALGTGFSGGTTTISAVAVAPNGTVYVGGAFFTAGSVTANHVARWNGTSWSALGAGVGGDGLYAVVRALAVAPNGDLYAGGTFTTAGGASANYVARWNGTAWSPLGAGLNGIVMALAFGSGGELYAGGAFTTAGGTAASNLARWNGSTWSALGTGLNGQVTALAAGAGGVLYAGGTFTTAGGAPANRVARWNGTAWNALGTGLNSNAYALALAPGGDLYVGGQFTTAGGVTVNRVARWNGTAWNALGSGISVVASGIVNALAVGATGDVYAGGLFVGAGGTPAKNLARWNGTAWSAVGTGLSGVAGLIGNAGAAVSALAMATDDAFYAGGDFTNVGDGSRVVAYFGRYALSVAPNDLVVTSPQSVPGGTYRSLTVSASGVATLTGPITVTQSLTVEAGGELATGCQPITGAGTFALLPGATLRICDPAGISPTGATGAVQVTGARTFAADATYAYAGTQPQLTGSGLPPTVRELVIQNAAGVSLSQPAAVTHALRLNAGTLSTGDLALTLRSSATRTAYAVHNGGTTSGLVTVQRYVGGPAALSYRHLSAPVQSTTVADLATAAYTPFVNAAYNAIPTPSLPLARFPSVFGFDETRGGAVATFGLGWYSPAALTAGLTAGRGWNVLMTGAQTPDFVGALTTGPVTLSGLTRTGAFLGSTQKSGWHLLGNPYAQPIDWDLVSVPTGMSNSISVFRTTGGANGTYLTRANGLGTLTDGVVPVGQGFFARVTGAGPVSFTFTNALRVEANPATVARPAPDARPVLSLVLAATSRPELRDETFVYAQAGATAGADDRFDGFKPARNVGAPTLASLIGEAEAAVNGLPETALAQPTTVELTAVLPQSGTYALTVGRLANFAGTPVVLLDRLTNTRYDLATRPVLTLTAERPDQQYPGRFALLFGPAATVTGAPALGAAPAAFGLWPNPAAGGPVTVSGLAAGQAVRLLDATGRLVGQALADETGAARLPTAGLPAGFYLVQAATQVQRLVID